MVYKNYSFAYSSSIYGILLIVPLAELRGGVWEALVSATAALQLLTSYWNGARTSKTVMFWINNELDLPG